METNIKEVEKVASFIKCGWLALGQRCNIPLGKDSTSEIFRFDQKIPVCRYHRKLAQAIEQFDSHMTQNRKDPSNTLVT